MRFIELLVIWKVMQNHLCDTGGSSIKGIRNSFKWKDENLQFELGRSYSFETTLQAR
jgi:hypothetical protein